MQTSYKNRNILATKIGNNAFAWKEKCLKYGIDNPTLTIPSLISGNIEDVKIGTTVAFEEIENGVLKSCMGLENFVQIGENIVIFDNHNHALYFWIDAIKKGIISTGIELIHIDEHSDLWNNENSINREKALYDEEYMWNFTNLSCNVGNYILPAIESGIINNIIRIENEYQIDAYMNYTPNNNSVLNLDLDIFATELDYIPEEKKIRIITNLLRKVKYVTIATSPFFIDQGIAISKLQQIMKRKKE